MLQNLNSLYLSFEMEEDVGLLNPTFITYKEFKAKLDIYSGPKENEVSYLSIYPSIHLSILILCFQVKQLLIKFDSVKEQIKNLRIQIDRIPSILVVHWKMTKFDVVPILYEYTGSQH